MSAIDATAPAQLHTGKMQKLPDSEATGVDGAVPEIVWPPRVIQPAPPPGLGIPRPQPLHQPGQDGRHLDTPDGYDGLLRAATAARQRVPGRFPAVGNALRGDERDP